MEYILSGKKDLISIIDSTNTGDHLIMTSEHFKHMECESLLDSKQLKYILLKVSKGDYLELQAILKADLTVIYLL